MRTSGVPMAWCVAALGLAAQTSTAQPVFFDDFDGNALLPHWRQPPPSHWRHNVSNGMLNVTALLFPSHPKSTGNYASMSAAYAPQTDFRMDVWMGWETGSQPHRLALSVFAGPGQGAVIASFGYRLEAWAGPDPLVYATAGGQLLNMPAPAPGIHLFTIARIGTQFRFMLNGSSFASFQDNFGSPAAGVGLFFLGPYPGQLGVFHVDRVQVVPAPSTLALPAGLMVVYAKRRRH